MFSDDAAADAQQLVKDLHWDSIDYEIDEELLDLAAEEFIQLGRVPITDFRTVWAKLDVANMSMYELAGQLVQITDPEWDKGVQEFSRTSRDLGVALQVSKSGCWKLWL